MWIPFYLFLRLLLLAGRWGHGVTYEFYARWTCSRRACLRRAAKVILDDLPTCPVCHTPRWPEFMGKECQFCVMDRDIEEGLALSAEDEPVDTGERKGGPHHRLNVWFSDN